MGAGLITKYNIWFYTIKNRLSQCLVWQTVTFSLKSGDSKAAGISVFRQVRKALPTFLNKRFRISFVLHVVHFKIAHIS